MHSSGYDAFILLFQEHSISLHYRHDCWGPGISPHCHVHSHSTHATGKLSTKVTKLKELTFSDWHTHNKVVVVV